MLWVLRDFVLLIKDLKGNRVSSRNYLESVLNDVPVSKDGYARNEDSIKVRKTILNFFKYRDCITLLRPTNKEQDLRNLQNLEDSKLRPKFMDELFVIRDKIYREC